MYNNKRIIKHVKNILSNYRYKDKTYNIRFVSDTELVAERYTNPVDDVYYIKISNHKEYKTLRYLNDIVNIPRLIIGFILPLSDIYNNKTNIFDTCIIFTRFEPIYNNILLPNLGQTYNKYSINNKKLVMFNLIELVYNIHKRDHVHGDIRMDNLIVYDLNVYTIDLKKSYKICKFCNKQNYNNFKCNKCKLRSSNDTYYSPPESKLLNNYYPGKEYDLWSLGMVLKELFNIFDTIIIEKYIVKFIHTLLSYNIQGRTLNNFGL